LDHPAEADGEGSGEIALIKVNETANQAREDRNSRTPSEIIMGNHSHRPSMINKQSN
jgi:hypothetical protein